MRKSKSVLLLEKLLKHNVSTSAQDTGIANSNQYYVELERKGIVGSRWVIKDGSRYKERFIIDRGKALKYIKRYA